MPMRSGRCLATTVVLALSLVCLLACGNSPRSPSMNPAGPSGMQGGAAGGSSGMPGAGGMGGMSVSIASEFDYLVQMIPHHEEAIVTARLLAHGTSRAELRTFAQGVIETQSSEVRQMRAWLAQWHPGRDTEVAYVPMMRDLTGLTGDALDRAFLSDMIPHHMMAVMMSQQFLGATYTRHPETLPFATRIRDTQQREILAMQGWLRAWFGGAMPMAR